MAYLKYSFLLSVPFLLFACHSKQNKPINAEANQGIPTVVTTSSETVQLDPPFATPSVKNYSKVIGWSDNTPSAPNGLMVTKFAVGLNNPRWIYQAPDGDIFIAESSEHGKSADDILLYRGIENGKIPHKRYVFLKGLNKPFGMLVIGNNFYVANTDAVVEYPYQPGDTVITSAGKKIISLPAGPRHWTRNIIANSDGSKIFIAVGSSTDHAENGIDKETNRANIIEINPDGSGEKIYASGLRNPVGMSWQPGTNKLWVAVNERDELGDNLVPDYITSVKEGGFYGWPYSYFGNHQDPRVKEQRQDLIDKAIVPDYALDNHSSSLGLAFYNKDDFPNKYKGGAFVGQHGSWNKSTLSGYKVVFVPFKDGKPSGKAEDFLTGFVADKRKSEVYGRPVGVCVLQDGTLLVADDAGNTVWRVASEK